MSDIARARSPAETLSDRASGLSLAAAVAGVAALWAASVWGVVALASLGVLVALRDRCRENRALAAGLLLAAAILGPLPELVERAPGEGRWRARVDGAYDALWRGLEQAAASAARDVDPPRDPHQVQATFARLQALAKRPALADKSILLLDPGGAPVAWAGEGLLHEPEAESLPTSGTTFRRSYTAATLLAIAPLATENGLWRLVVGRSFDVDRWPFPGTTGLAVPWTVTAAYAGPNEVPVGALALQRDDWPTLLLAWPPPPGRPELASWLPRVAAVVLALTLTVVALLHLRRRRRSPATHDVRPRAPALLLVAAVAATTRALALPPTPAWTLITAAVLVAGAVLAHRAHRLPPWTAAAAGALAALSLVLVAVTLQRAAGRQELAAAFFAGSREVLALRLAFFLATAGLFGLASRLGRVRAGAGIGWLAVALLAAAAASHDLPAIALPLLTAAGATVALWLAGRRSFSSPATLTVTLLVLALGAATAWELAYRQVLRETLADDDLPRLAPPTREEQHAIFLELHGFFETVELSSLLPFGDVEVDPQDLAFALWRRSPLAQRDGLSALVIEPADRLPLAFSFDLPLDVERRNLVWDYLERLGIPPTDAWRSRLIEGETELLRRGRPWARGRYFFLPRLGFRFDVSEIDELETALLRGRPHRRAVDGLPPEVRYALYRPDGVVAFSSWRQAPPLGSDQLAGGTGRLLTPAGLVWYAVRRDEDGVGVLYLPLLGVPEALARVGIHGLGSLAPLAVAALLTALLVLMPWRSWRGALLGVVRSYSRRLLLVYTVLLFVPLVALNLVLLRGFEERQRQQQIGEGEAALASARTLLAGALTSMAVEGFIFDDAFFAPVLNRISSVVHHEVNLYWQGKLLSSSQQALFTAGLLPGRIPGDIYTRLILRGNDFASRDRASGDVDYLEIYTSLREEADFVLSVPMLEQLEETARELAAMRRRAVLVSAALFALLIALGGRLARGFTTPLQELVEGTRRIAAGARSLELAPRELELAALVRAIDDMARRIAEGREKLVREKQVVERMVQNITSAVVSLDRERRVLLHNRVAQELLGTEIGCSIEDALATRPHLEPVRDFVATGGGGRQRTVLLPGLEGPPAGPTTPVVGESAEPREWTLTWVPVPGGGDPAALLVVDDDTEVLRGQRLAAWAEMARIIAHEIKNPLTPIRLSAEHMREVYERDPERFDEIFERCTNNILVQVEELGDIASQFSTYSRIPRAELRPADLVTEMAELIGAYRHVAPAEIAFSFAHPQTPVAVRLDSKLLRRAVRNLLENALRASVGNGQGRVTLVVESAAGRARIRVADRGPGVPRELLPRIFEPYFSTHETGTGLGLPITRRIVEQHGGTIEAKNRRGGGLEVVITMPLAADPIPLPV